MLHRVGSARLLAWAAGVVAMAGCGGAAAPAAPAAADEPLSRDAGRARAGVVAARCAPGSEVGPDGRCQAGPRRTPARADRSAVPACSGSADPERPTGGLARGSGDAADRALLAGDRSLEQGLLDAAERHYQRARALAPTDPAPRVGLVRVRLERSNVPTSFAAAPDHPVLAELLRELGQILEHSAGYGPAELERGRIALIRGEAGYALQALRRAAQLLPCDAEAQSALGVALLATGSKEAALGYLRRAASLDRDNPDRLANLGTVELTLGNVTAAIRAYRRAVTLAPEDARANGDLGTAYLAANEPRRALPFLQRAVRLAPERATFLSNLGYAWQLVGRHAEAIRTYQRALAVDPNLVEAHINLGALYARLGRYAEAEQSLQRAHALAPDDPRVEVNLTELEQLRQKRQR